ncbi:MAG: hypothetical protein AAB316_10465 [Bacteroidota bacterium]
MKKREAYPLTGNPKKDTFRFNSVGTKGVIPKIIEFSPLPGGKWNLAFGDVKGNDWTDDVVSDNNDMRKVLQTVANAAHAFSERYPDRKIHIEPLDNPRKLLYNRLIQLKMSEIEETFLVEGILLDEDGAEMEPEKFDPDKLYDAFVLTRKKPNFEQ